MDGIHDLGGRQGFGRGALRARRAGVPRAVGEARQRALRARGAARHLQHGRVPPRDRAHGAAPLPVGELLRALAHEPRDAVRREGRRHARGARAARRRRVPAGAAERAGPRRTSPARRALRARRPGAGAGRPRAGPRPHAGLHPRQGAASWSSESPAYPFPDAHAHGVAAEDEPTYDVRFSSEELWPNSADAALVHVGVFQSYLEREA